MKKFAMMLAVAMGLPSALWSQSVTTDFGKPQLLITDESIGYADRTFDKDTVYVLKGYVYFEAPGTLTIQPGTVIKGLNIVGGDTVSGKASCLIITRDAYINAQGTPTEPIIFTTQFDSVTLADNDPNDGVDYTVDQGLWGGVIICGRATLNVADSAYVEGLPTTDARALYGGTDDNDSSGVMRYVSIRYSGKTIESNRELQSLTVCCAGRGTVFEYIESFRSSDDGFEFFGGTFNTRYLVSIFADDDAFDYDQGFRGNHQFWFAMQASNGGDRIGEFDSGDTGALTNPPLSNPLIYNATFLGRGSGATGGGSVLNYKEFGGGRMYNSIFADFPTTNAFDVDSGSGTRSYNRLLDSTDQLVNQYNIWFKTAGQTTFSQFVSQVFEYNYLSNPANNNSIVDPQLTSISRAVGTTLDPRPSAGGPAYTLPRKALPVDPWWTAAGYYGAFSAGANWLNGWTTLSQLTIVDVADDGSAIHSGPTVFKLDQNYPNPFNPATTISFDVAREGKVKLTVYNVIGQEVATLVNDVRPVGNYKITWNASSLASGVYFYRLEAGAFVTTKKMLLMK